MDIVKPRRTSFAGGGGGAFVAMCYELFLGRELDGLGVANERGRWPGDEILRSIIESDEFASNLKCLLAGRPLAQDPARNRLTIAQRFWVTENLPLSCEAAEVVWETDDRRAILVALLRDEMLMNRAGLCVVPEIPEPLDDDSSAGEHEEGGRELADRIRPLWTESARELHLWR